MVSTRNTPREHGPERTLVVYVFADTDPEYWNNFMFFLREGLQPDSESTQFAIVIQTDSPASEDLSRYPKLPPNAAYFLHLNRCYDWGTYGWLLRSGEIETDSYDYFIFLNCSVRGPFLPLYLRGRADWKDALIAPLKDEAVKLSGTTISCEPKLGFAGLPSLDNPHVQSFAVATDQVGLQLLRNSTVFACHTAWDDAVYFAELTSSKVVLDAGFNLASVMVKFQGVDWRDRAHWGCNTRTNPSKYYMYDGLDVDPLESLFVKFKHSFLAMRMPYVVRALALERALNASASESGHLMPQDLDMLHESAAKQVCMSQAQAARTCFDSEAYTSLNGDALPAVDERGAWAHYMTSGQFSGARSRFACNETVGPLHVLHD